MLTKHKLYEILDSRFPEADKKLSEIYSPLLLEGAEKSAKRVADGIRGKQKITLIGDYDVDGVISTAIMADFFRLINYPLETIIPNRFRDGYGVSASVLERVDCDLLLTVDNGISAIEAAKICDERGIDLIITDHHTPSSELPIAYAIVNPKLPTCSYPFKEICGAEVAWLLLALVKKELHVDINMKSFLDMLCLAIIADIMPLVDINRTLVKEGLKMLLTSTRPASIIIKDFLAKSVITSQDIAFMIAPRVNSAGRLEDASLALDFFLSANTSEAYKRFELLNSLNDKRKETEADTTAEAIREVDENDLITIVAKNGWHEGVVGIVASRLVDKFEKPAIVLSIENGIAKGSARSLGEVDIYTLINENREHLIKFGGHKMAAGLGLHVENLEAFKKGVNATAKLLNSDEFKVKDETLGALATADIDLDMLSLLDNFEPYGEANSSPKFHIKNAQVIKITLMGSDKSHSRITIKQENSRDTLELVAFRRVYEMPTDRQISCTYSLSKNEFNGRVSVQLLVDKIYE